jgi:hypothetical protein
MQSEDLRAYRDRWQAVEAVEREEQRTASLELRWQQLNAILRMAAGLGLVPPDDDEAGVYARWARLKEAAMSQRC